MGEGNRSLNSLKLFQNTLQKEFERWLNPKEFWDGAMDTEIDIQPLPSTDQEEKHWLQSECLETSEVDLNFDRDQRIHLQTPHRITILDKLVLQNCKLPIFCGPILLTPLFILNIDKERRHLLMVCYAPGNANMQHFIWDFQHGNSFQFSKYIILVSEERNLILKVTQQQLEMWDLNEE